MTHIAAVHGSSFDLRYNQSTLPRILLLFSTIHLYNNASEDLFAHANIEEVLIPIICIELRIHLYLTLIRF